MVECSNVGMYISYKTMHATPNERLEADRRDGHGAGQN